MLKSTVVLLYNQVPRTVNILRFLRRDNVPAVYRTQRTSAERGLHVLINRCKPCISWLPGLVRPIPKYREYRTPMSVAQLCVSNFLMTASYISTRKGLLRCFWIFWLTPAFYTREAFARPFQREIVLEGGWTAVTWDTSRDSCHQVLVYHLGLLLLVILQLINPFSISTVLNFSNSDISHGGSLGSLTLRQNAKDLTFPRLASKILGGIGAFRPWHGQSAKSTQIKADFLTSTTAQWPSSSLRHSPLPPFLFESQHWYSWGSYVGSEKVSPEAAVRQWIALCAEENFLQVGP